MMPRSCSCVRTRRTNSRGWKAGYRNYRARRNRQQWGPVMFLAVLGARLGQVLTVHLPRLIWSKLRRAEDRALSARCLLWRAEGYVRFALSFLAPRLFAQRAFLSWLEFRSERELFGAPEGSTQ